MGIRATIRASSLGNIRPGGNTVFRTSILNSINKLSVRSTGVSGSGSGVSNLRELHDVDASTLANGSSIIYDSTSDKFEVKDVPFISGGSF